MSSAPDHYSEDGFWSKVGIFAKQAGKEVVTKSLLLYYVAADTKTPTWAKLAIYGALGYFILPVDAIPDFVPVVGYTDDLGALAACVTAVAVCTSDLHHQQAGDTARQWFG